MQLLLHEFCLLQCSAVFFLIDFALISLILCALGSHLQGRQRFQQLQKYVALAFAVVQAVGQLTYIRPYVNDWSLYWLIESTSYLVAGSAILIYVSIWSPRLDLLILLILKLHPCSSDLCSCASGSGNHICSFYSLQVVVYWWKFFILIMLISSVMLRFRLPI